MINRIRLLVSKFDAVSVREKKLLISLLKLFIKLSTRLIDKFYKINDLHVKFHITGTDLRCLHKIRCKLL